MVNILSLLGAGILEAAFFVWLMYFLIERRKGRVVASLNKLRENISERRGLFENVKKIFSEMIDASVLKERILELRSVKEALKTQRGKIAITEAELETVENRLRELEEIEREVAASGIETKEEISILEKRKKELVQKQQTLNAQIADSMTQIEKAIASGALDPELKGDVESMKGGLTQSGEKNMAMINQIDFGGLLYIGMKKRYDALDIEYAQLFEKFSAAEEISKKEKERLNKQ